MLYTCRQKSSQIAKHKQYVIAETWATFIAENVTQLKQHIAFEPIHILDFMRIKLPRSMTYWAMDGDYFQRTKLHYVHMCHIVVETIVDNLFILLPLATYAQEMKYKKEKLVSKMEISRRVGFGTLGFYLREEPKKVKHDLEYSVLINRNLMDSSPFKAVFHHLAAAVIPELFSRVAPYEGGLEQLTEYTKADKRYMHPNFIAGIILAPVTRIVSIIMEIMDQQDLWEKPAKGLDCIKCIKTINKNKVRIEILLKNFYTLRYLKTLCAHPPPLQIEHKNEEIQKMQNNWFGFQELADKYLGTMPQTNDLGMLPVILYNLPREFERWHDHYGQEGKNISNMRRYWHPLPATSENLQALSEDISDEQSDGDYMDTDGVMPERTLTQASLLRQGFKFDKDLEHSLPYIDLFYIECENTGEVNNINDDSESENSTVGNDVSIKHPQSC